MIMIIMKILMCNEIILIIIMCVLMIMIMK